MSCKNKTARFLRFSVFGALALFFLWDMNIRFSFSEEIRYQSGDRRDPFIPVNQKAAPGSAEVGIKVEGIIYDSKGRSIVVIHGEPYKAGDSVADHKIVAIYPSKIVASLKGVESEYWISNEEKELAEAKKNKGT